MVGRPKGSITIPELGKSKKPGPKPKELVAKVANAVGRPPGLKAKLAELRARLILTHGDSVMDKIVAKALDDGDKDQAMMLKLLFDKQLPVEVDSSSETSIEVEINDVGKGTTVTVTTGGTGKVTRPQADVVDVEMVEVPNGKTKP
jgi:hypothetical protein